MTLRSLAIVGAGGHGRVVADCATAAGWQQVSFYDDSYPNIHKSGKWSVIGNCSQLMGNMQAHDGVIVAFGDGMARLKRHRALCEAGATLISVIHPRAWVSQTASIGSGVLVGPCAVVNTSAMIGDAVIINTSASVDHDCVIGDGVHIAPGVHMSGNVRVGELSWIGVGAAVKQGISIGAQAMIGAGAVVVSDIPAGVTAVGCPAKPRV